MAVELGTRFAALSRRPGDCLPQGTTQRLPSTRHEKERDYSPWLLGALLLIIFFVLCVCMREHEHLTLTASSTTSKISATSYTASSNTATNSGKDSLDSLVGTRFPNKTTPDLSLGPRQAAPVRAPAPQAKSLESGREEPPPGLYREDAPLDAVNPAGRNFNITDKNSPTKFPCPPHGFPPRQLPPGHRLSHLLRQLRKLTVLRPRWPDHPELHFQKLKSFGPAYASIVFSEKLKVVYVPVFKVGTTSVMWNIAYLENIEDVVTADMSSPGVRARLMHEISNPFWNERALGCVSSIDRVRSVLNNPEYLKFGFVRNPYDRIVSAYLDRVKRRPLDEKVYQAQMYSLYGNDKAMRKLRNETKPTFKEFLTAVKRVVSTPRTKTFDLRKAEAYEDKRSRRDIHWRPQVELLHPDLIHFDFIGKLDRMDEDKEHVLKWMYKHTDRRLPAGKIRENATDPKDKVLLFKMLREDHEMRDLVVETYKEDFQRFGFSTDVPPENERSM